MLQKLGSAGSVHTVVEKNGVRSRSALKAGSPAYVNPAFSEVSNNQNSAPTIVAQIPAYRKANAKARIGLEERNVVSSDNPPIISTAYQNTSTSLNDQWEEDFQNDLSSSNSLPMSTCSTDGPKFFKIQYGLFLRLQRNPENEDDDNQLIAEFFSNLSDISLDLKDRIDYLNRRKDSDPGLIPIMSNIIQTLDVGCDDNRLDVLDRVVIAVMAHTWIADAVDQSGNDGKPFNWGRFLVSAKKMHNEYVFDNLLCRFGYYPLIPASVQFNCPFFNPCSGSPLFKCRIPLFSKLPLALHHESTHIRSMYKRLLQNTNVCQFASPSHRHMTEERYIFRLLFPSSSIFYEFCKAFKEQSTDYFCFVDYVVSHLLGSDTAKEKLIDQDENLKVKISDFDDDCYKKLEAADNNNDDKEGAKLAEYDDLAKVHNEGIEKILKDYVIGQILLHSDDMLAVNKNSPIPRKLSMFRLMKEFNNTFDSRL